MKVVILAAGINKNIDFTKPKCLLPYKDGTILSYQIALLKSVGIRGEDIVLVIGGKGEEWSDQSRQEIVALHDNVIINTKNLNSKNSLSLFLAIREIEDELIVLDGDVILESEIVKELLHRRGQNVIVSRIAYSISEKGGKIEVENGRVRKSGEFLKPTSYPWYIHSGLVRLNKEILDDLRVALRDHPAIDIIDNINSLLGKHEFLNLDYFPHNLNIDGPDLKGGSYAILEKLLVVRKEARGKGAQKVKNEIEWLNRLPMEIRDKFTRVRHYGLDEDYAWFEMDYHQMPCLRELLLDRRIVARDAIEAIVSVMEFMFKEVYSRKVARNTGGWIWDKHIVRVNSRLIQTKNEAPLFDKIMRAEKIILNKQSYENIPLLIKELCERPAFIKELEPKYLRMVHGDLHFQNILIDANNINNFILTDPRGELEGSDLYYDIGKLWHSFNGLYDFLHTDLFDLKIELKDKILYADLKYKLPEVIVEYNDIKNVISKKILDYELIKMDNRWELKTLFTEAMHFSSLMPFHLKGDGEENRAVAMYLTGVKLLNQLFNTFEIRHFPKEKKLINVNSNGDYLELLEQNKI